MLAIDKTFLTEVKSFREQLHSEPELSGKEINTLAKITEKISHYKPDRIISFADNHARVFVFNGRKEGPGILLRAEMDALPIREFSTKEYASLRANISHSCGHDGHMAILAGMGKILSKERPVKGWVGLLFQHAEETGKGAREIVSDSNFQNLKANYIFALHNLPGEEQNLIISRRGVFALASKGLLLKITGEPSHAAYPELAKSPAEAVGELIRSIKKISSEINNRNHLANMAIVYLRMGKPDFGILPGNARLGITFRAMDEADMDYMVSELSRKIIYTCNTHNLNYKFEWHDEFPQTTNHDKCVNIIEKAAAASNLNFRLAKDPFRWSEDFGHFTSSVPGAIFCIGAGKNHPQIHTPAYDFPEEILETGIQMFYQIVRKLTS